MKIYGFDDTDVVRGEIRAAEVDAYDLEIYPTPEALGGSVGWEYGFRSFKAAKKKLLELMTEDPDVNPDALALAKTHKAAWVPLD